MFKKFLLVILGFFVLAAAAVTVHLPARHFAFRVFSGMKLYQSLAERYQSEASCTGGDDIQLCLTKIIKDSGGFKFGTDVGMAMALLLNNKVTYDAYMRGNVVIVSSIEPEKFWIRTVKGKAAKRLFKKEKKDLLKALIESRNQYAKALLEKRYPASEEDQRILIEVLDRKIVELSK